MLLAFFSEARTLYAVTNNGSFENAIWSLTLGGAACCTPQGGDILIIPNGINVNVTGNTSIGGGAVYILVDSQASLTFTNCNSNLTLQAGSGIQVNAATADPATFGLLDTSSSCGGGNSNKIRIGTDFVWQSKCNGNGTPCDNGPYNFGDVTILPVDIMTFGANLQKQGVFINWTTTKEIDIDGFVVEKSMDARHFETIADAKALGNDNQINTYQRIDYKPFEGISYYRLKILNKDRSIRYSSIVSVQNNKLGLNVYQNTEGSLVIASNLQSKQQAHIRIMDVLGREIYSQYVEVGSEKLEIILPVLKNTAATYVARIQIGAVIENKKIVVGI